MNRVNDTTERRGSSRGHNYPLSLPHRAALNFLFVEAFVAPDRAHFTYAQHKRGPVKAINPPAAHRRTASGLLGVTYNPTKDALCCSTGWRAPNVSANVSSAPGHPGSFVRSAAGTAVSSTCRTSSSKTSSGRHSIGARRDMDVPARR